MITTPYFVTYLDDDDIDDALAEDNLSPADLVLRDGVSIPGWYWAKTHAPHSLSSARDGKLRGPYLTQQEAFSDARRSVH